MASHRYRFFTGPFVWFELWVSPHPIHDCLWKVRLLWWGFGKWKV